jgi:HSP20 family protein
MSVAAVLGEEAEVSIGDWDIFGEMERLRRGLDRVSAGSWAADHRGPHREALWTPPVDIQEQGDSLLLAVDLPGLKRDDIGLQVDGGTLTIEGERTRGEASGNIRLERPVGRFRRSFRIGVPIDPSGVRASYRDGVLTITIPKVTSAGPTRLRVDVE